jgi:serine/threonine-protein kinase
MEYLKGKSLKELITEQGMLPPAQALDISEQILQALQFAHEHDVVHRDIKPANIVINGSGQVKVTDFGIARAGTAAKMTETGSIIGTAQYLSPEQARGKAVGQSSDLYSTGVVLYEMLTGRVPFEGENPVAIALKHLSDVPVPPQALVPELPDNLNNVVLTSLAKDPAQRYHSAQEFLADLERCRQNLAVAAVPTGDDATQVIPAAAVAPLAATAAAPLSDSDSASGQPQKKSRAGKIALIILLIAAAIAAAAAVVYFLTVQGQAVEVPNVTGLTLQAAEDTLQADGFKVTVEAEEYSETVPQGSVIRQNPEAGETLKEGGTVRLVVSRGSDKVAVPDLVGQTASYAESKLEESELRGDRQPDAYSDTVSSGSIISQDPVAGTEIERDSTVKYVVSKGSEPPGDVIVPNLEGMTQSEAQSSLNGEGLVLGSVSEDYSDTVPAGRVISQSPAAGQTISEGSTVNITLSLGPEPVLVPVPDVIGDPLATAETKITNAGLTSTAITVVDPPNAGNVIDQSPAALTDVPEGSTVTITIATL